MGNEELIAEARKCQTDFKGVPDRANTLIQRFEQKMWMRPDEAAAIAEYLSRPAVAARPLPDRETIAAHLNAIHFDGNGCKTTGPNGCSNCFGPSPMSALEVADAVLSLFTTDTTEENPNG